MNGFELVRRHHIRLIVGIGVFTAIVTQILMQTGGGERDGIFDLVRFDYRMILVLYQYCRIQPARSNSQCLAPALGTFRPAKTKSSAVQTYMRGCVKLRCKIIQYCLFGRKRAPKFPLDTPSPEKKRRYLTSIFLDTVSKRLL